MLIDRARIAELIPHSGTMCLLDAVRSWDATAIACTATSHRLADNPMRIDGALGSACAIEYAAQAMAVHGTLTQQVGARPRAGLLVALRDLQLGAGSLSTCAETLEIEAEQLGASAGGVLYAFRVHDGKTEFARGRAMVVLDAGGVAA